MSRIKKLETHYHEQLIDHNIKDVSEFIKSILNADITHGKYARFLIESFLNDKFLEEDLMGGLESTVGQAISLFDKHKGKLPINERSVYALDEETGEALYQSPGDLWNKVKQYQGELSGKELKKEEQEKIYRETEFVYKDEETGFQIISPLTEESAKWWGKGTRWCTSADKNNWFYDYAKDAPLFILLMPNGDKLQFWKYDYRIQFMDEADNEVALKYIEQHWTILEPICLWLNDIKYIPEKYFTKEICELAVSENGRALEYIPEELKTPELCKLAANNNGMAWAYIPKGLITQELCNIAIQKNDDILDFVPEKYKTKDFYTLLIKKNGKQIFNTPKELITKELCELAIQQNGMALYYIPEKYKTKELCELAVNQKGCALQFIPDKYITKELCEIAVKQNGYALEYTPKTLRTEKLCKIAVQQNSDALKYVPDKYKTKNFCELAVQQNGVALLYIPEKYQTFEIYKLAVQNSGISLTYVPKELRTKELYYLAVQNDGLALYSVPMKLRTKELCELAYKQNKSCFKMIPMEYQEDIKNNNKLTIDKEKYNVTYKGILDHITQRTKFSDASLNIV